MMENVKNREACKRYYEKTKLLKKPSRAKRTKELHQAAPWMRLLRSAKDRSRINGIRFDLTVEWALSNYFGSCAVTGLPFSLTDRFYAPSIDRIDSSLGYTQENCRFVLWSVNVFRQDKTDDDIRYIAKHILKPKSRTNRFEDFKERFTNSEKPVILQTKTKQVDKFDEDWVRVVNLVKEL